jgi:hypothetical protein
MRKLFLLLILMAALPALSEPLPAELRAEVARLPEAERRFIAGAKYAGRYAPSRLVTFSTHAGRWRAEFHLPRELVRQFHDPAPLVIRLKGSPHLWSVHRRKAGTLDPGLSLINLTCYAPADPGPFHKFSLASDGVSVTVSAQDLFGHPLWQSHLTLAQSERAFHASFRLAADKYTPRRLRLDEFSQIQTQVPDFWRNYAVPVLRRLGPGRAAADMYRVFDQIPADPKVTREILPLIARLGADDIGERDAAARELRTRGRPALLAAMRLDPALLSPEQNSRLAWFRATDGWVRVEDVESARRDEAFLESCLEDEDPAVRVAAANTLAAVRAGRLLRR